MQLVLTTSDAKVRVTFTGADGEATAPTSPTVTITRDSDGTEIVTDGVATDEGEGVVSYTLDGADIPTVDLLTAEWSGTGATAPDTEVGVVGGFLCSPEAISAAIVASGSSAPSALELREVRERVEDWLEHACNVAFRPSYARDTLEVCSVNDVLLSNPRPLTLLSATLDDTDIFADLTLLDGIVSREATMTGVLDITYAHGFEDTPERITRAAVQLAVALNETTATSGVSRFREDDQEFWLTVPGMGGSETSLPDVNAAINAYRYPSVG